MLLNNFHISSWILDSVRNDILKTPKQMSEQMQDDYRDANDTIRARATKSPNDAKLNLISSILPKSAEFNGTKVKKTCAPLLCIF